MENLLTVLVEQKRGDAINLLGEVRRIMKALEMDDPLDELSSAKDYSFLDIIEANNIVKDVILARLKDGKDNYAAGSTANERILLHSIQEEAKDAVKSYFRMPGHKSLKFVQLYNQLVVEKIIDTLQAAGMDNAKQTIEAITKDAKNTILHNTADTTEFSFREAQRLLKAYQTQRKRTFRDKKAVSQYERVDIIKNLHQMTS